MAVRLFCLVDQCGFVFWRAEVHVVVKCTLCLTWVVGKLSLARARRPHAKLPPVLTSAHGHLACNPIQHSFPLRTSMSGACTKYIL